uniref:Uncharacterized protein n=1 Tax=Anguilla anguilla TaxID=7936 RepID=A0A0E9R2S9_ANGAN
MLPVVAIKYLRPHCEYKIKINKKNTAWFHPLLKEIC